MNIAVLFGVAIVFSLIVFGLNMAQANKRKIANNAKKSITSTADDKNNSETPSIRNLRHLNDDGAEQSCNGENCEFPKGVHYYRSFDRRTVENWVDWREMEMARAAAASEAVLKGDRVWHTDGYDRIVPCNRHVKTCPYQSKHFDTHEEAVSKLPKYYKPYVILYQSMQRGYALKDLVRRIYEDRLIIAENPNFFKNYENVDELLEEEGNGKDKTDDAPTSTLSPEALVKSIKVEIGQLRGDICWVIDNPAFFDTHSPVTSELFLKLGEWDDNYTSWDINRLRKASSNIEKLFKTAKEEAAKLGFDYLHGKTRKSMETASSLAHKALSTTHEQEQVTLMEKVAAILSETLGLTIPRQTVKAVEGYVRKGLTSN